MAESTSTDAIDSTRVQSSSETNTEVNPTDRTEEQPLVSQDEPRSSASAAVDPQEKHLQRIRRAQMSRVSPTIAVRLSLLSIFLTIAIFTMVYKMTKLTLPTVDTFEPSDILPFNNTNAMNHIRHMGGKIRYPFSQNLYDSLLYIEQYAKSFEETAKKNDLLLEIDYFQSKHSSFSMFMSKANVHQSYSNISSVIVKISPKHKHHLKSLLITAHVDSAVDTAGVSDELSGIGIMMEVMRGILETGYLHLNRPIIFLFDGAEEIVLLGAHSFVTQHKWANNIAVHINLESIGSGNELTLFRLGPKNPWIANAYADAVSNPTGTVTATDLYETKLIPGETDFRIFNEHGGIPGYDFVFIENGYIYHTRHDDLNHVSEQGILHGGITTYQLAMHLAGFHDAIGKHINDTQKRSAPPSLIRRTAHYLNTNIKQRASNNKFQSPATDNADSLKVVYFDVLHTFTIVYDEEIATFINITIMIVSVLLWVIFQLRKWTVSDWRMCLRMSVVMMVSIFGGLLSSTYAALIYNKILNAKIIWFGSIFKALLVFCPPLLFGMLTVMIRLLPKKLPLLHYDFMLFSISLFHFILALICTKQNIMSGYIFAFLLLSTSICGTIQSIIYVPSIIKHIQITAAHAFLTCRIVTDALSVFLPLIGRLKVGGVNDSKLNLISHDMIASWVIGVVITLFIGLPCIPILSYYAGALKKLRRLTLGFSLWVAVLLIIVSPKLLNEHKGYDVKTPYSVDAPKRLSFHHFYMKEMGPTSVLMLASMDSVDLDLSRLSGGLVELNESIKTLDGKPTYFEPNDETNEELMQVDPTEVAFPFPSKLQYIHWLESDNIPSLNAPQVDILQEEYMEELRKWNVTVEIKASGANLITFRIRSADNELGVVTQWSLDIALEDSTGYVWVKHHGILKLKIWMIVDAYVQGSETKRKRVAMVLCNSQSGLSNVSQDLVAINENMMPWESPWNSISVATQVVL